MRHAIRHVGLIAGLSATLWACSSSTVARAATQRVGDPPAGLQAATFAGGCFWCMEPPFEKLTGVKAVISGYTGGRQVSPSYEQVSSGVTGHAEAVRVIFDPKVVSYEQLLQVFWRSMDPTDAGGQFADRGSQYRPAIFVHSPAQRKAATASKLQLERSDRFHKPIVVGIVDVGPFYQAESYHQDYYKTHPDRYQRYREGSGRAGFLRRVWGDDARGTRTDTGKH